MSIESALIDRFSTDVAALVAGGASVTDAVSKTAGTIVSDASALGTDLATSATALIGVAIVSAGGLAITTEQAVAAAATGAVAAAAAVSDAAGARVRDAIIGAMHGIEAVITTSVEAPPSTL